MMSMQAYTRCPPLVKFLALIMPLCMPRFLNFVLLQVQRQLPREEKKDSEMQIQRSFSYNWWVQISLCFLSLTVHIINNSGDLDLTQVLDSTYFFS